MNFPGARGTRPVVKHLAEGAIRRMDQAPGATIVINASQ
jgi:hypothetical protein